MIQHTGRGRSVSHPEQVGDMSCYPEYEWERISLIPKEAAFAWVLQIIPDVNLGGMTPAVMATEQPDTIFIHGSIWGWLNKLYVVVENDGMYIKALYAHDRSYWIIRKKIA